MTTTAARGLFFDDVRSGFSFSTPRLTVTEEAIIGFAQEWDPQPFHLDQMAAQSSVFAGLCGSGLHTTLLTYRLYLQHGLFEGTAVAGLGIDGVRFLHPMRPSDTLQVHGRIKDARLTRHPERGLVVLALQTYNQHGQMLLELQLTLLVQRRTPGSDTV